jgi:beta-glucosidase
MTRPVRELKGIAQVSIAAGQSAEVSFTLSRRDLEFVGRDLQWTAEPGMFDVWIAPSSTQGVAKSVQLTAP